MKRSWRRIALALGVAAGMLLVPGGLLAQEEHHKPKEQPPKEQQPPPQQKPAPSWVDVVQHATAGPLPQPNNPPQKLSKDRQQGLISQQKQRTHQYDQNLQKQQKLVAGRSQTLQRQNRSQQYRFQQRYLDRLHQQQLALSHPRDFINDPFFFTAASYRYMRGGRYYEVNQYAAQLLYDAVNYGYEVGFQAGQADRADGWRFDCENSYAYQDANYGYEGFYIAADEYHYYFREGFRRGYDDGYYGRYRYGQTVDGGVRILGDVLKVIIDLRVIH